MSGAGQIDYQMVADKNFPDVVKAELREAKRRYFQAISQENPDDVRKEKQQLIKQLQNEGVQYDKDKYDEELTIKLRSYSHNYEIMVLEVVYGGFRQNIFLLNIDRKVQKPTNFVGAHVYYYSAQQQMLAFKRIFFQSKNFQQKWRRVIQEYFLLRIASGLRTGPRTRQYWGFNIIVFNNAMQFCMEFGLNCCQILVQEIVKLSDLRNDIRRCLQINHWFKLIHFDVKVPNIVYSLNYSKFVLIDYGVSQIVKQEIGKKTLLDNFRGTHGYQSRQMFALLLKKNKKMQVDCYFNDIWGLWVTVRNIKGKKRLVRAGQYPNSCSSKLQLKNINKIKKKVLVYSTQKINREENTTLYQILFVLYYANFAFEQQIQQLFSYLYTRSTSQKKWVRIFIQNHNFIKKDIDQKYLNRMLPQQMEHRLYKDLQKSNQQFEKRYEKLQDLEQMDSDEQNEKDKQKMRQHIKKCVFNLMYPQQVDKETCCSLSQMSNEQKKLKRESIDKYLKNTLKNEIDTQLSTLLLDFQKIQQLLTGVQFCRLINLANGEKQLQQKYQLCIQFLKNIDFKPENLSPFESIKHAFKIIFSKILDKTLKDIYSKECNKDHTFLGILLPSLLLLQIPTNDQLSSILENIFTPCTNIQHFFQIYTGLLWGVDLLKMRSNCKYDIGAMQEQIIQNIERYVQQSGLVKGSKLDEKGVGCTSNTTFMKQKIMMLLLKGVVHTTKLLPYLQAHQIGLWHMKKIMMPLAIMTDAITLNPIEMQFVSIIGGFIITNVQKMMKQKNVDLQEFIQQHRIESELPLTLEIQYFIGLPSVELQRIIDLLYQNRHIQHSLLYLRTLKAIPLDTELLPTIYTNNISFKNFCFGKTFAMYKMLEDYCLSVVRLFSEQNMSCYTKIQMYCIFKKQLQMNRGTYNFEKILQTNNFGYSYFLSLCEQLKYLSYKSNPKDGKMPQKRRLHSHIFPKLFLKILFVVKTNYPKHLVEFEKILKEVIQNQNCRFCKDLAIQYNNLELMIKLQSQNQEEHCRGIDMIIDKCKFCLKQKNKDAFWMFMDDLNEVFKRKGQMMGSNLAILKIALTSYDLDSLHMFASNTNLSLRAFGKIIQKLPFHIVDHQTFLSLSRCSDQKYVTYFCHMLCAFLDLFLRTPDSRFVQALKEFVVVQRKISDEKMGFLSKQLGICFWILQNKQKVGVQNLPVSCKKVINHPLLGYYVLTCCLQYLNNYTSSLNNIKKAILQLINNISTLQTHSSQSFYRVQSLEQSIKILQKMEPDHKFRQNGRRYQYLKKRSVRFGKIDNGITKKQFQKLMLQCMIIDKNGYEFQRLTQLASKCSSMYNNLQEHDENSYDK